MSILRAFWPLLGASWAYFGRVLGLSWPPLGPIWTHLVAVFFSLLAAFVFPPFLSKIHFTHFRGCYFQASLLPRPDGRASLGRAWGLSCHSSFLGRLRSSSFLGWLRSDGRRWLPQRGFQLNPPHPALQGLACRICLVLCLGRRLALPQVPFPWPPYCYRA